MWTVDANKCPSCPDKEQCKDRKLIIQTLSELSHKLNRDPAHVDGPGDGIIIVACRQNH